MTQCGPHPRRAGIVAGLLLVLAGCSGTFSWNPLEWFRDPPPIVIPWDSISPPPLAAHVDSLEPPPAPAGQIPTASRFLQDIDVHHYDIELVIPPENDRVSSRTTIRYTREVAGAHQLALDFSGLTVRLVTADGVPVPFVQEEGRLRFDTPGRLGIYDTIQAEIMAAGTPDDGLILRENVHGSPTAFADNWPDRARFWFPTNDHPYDKATVSYTVHAPVGRRVVANGLPVGTPVPADSARVGGLPEMMTSRWESRVPIPTYLMVLGVAEMEVVDLGLAACGSAPASPRDDGCVEVTGWAFPPDTARAREAFAEAPRMIDTYVELFGPYPFEKLANVQSSARFGGMENASTIFYSESAISRGADISGTVAHEIVHQWFGNSVTPADWPHLWLSEGFATYFGALYWAQTLNDAAFRERIDAIRREYLASDVMGRPVVDEGVDSLFELLNENSYEKGALVLHMLRRVVGERAFFNGIRQFYREYEGGHATTTDFQRVMEGSHGDSLSWFFEQWLRQPGYPVLRAEWLYMPAQNTARVTITQEQDPGWPAFRFPIDLEFFTGGGVHRVSDWVEGRTWTREYALPGFPTELRIDPDGWLLAERRGEL